MNRRLTSRSERKSLYDECSTSSIRQSSLMSIDSWFATRETIWSSVSFGSEETLTVEERAGSNGRKRARSISQTSPSRVAESGEQRSEELTWLGWQTWRA